MYKCRFYKSTWLLTEWLNGGVAPEVTVYNGAARHQTQRRIHKRLTFSFYTNNLTRGNKTTNCTRKKEMEGNRQKNSEAQIIEM